MRKTFVIHFMYLTHFGKYMFSLLNIYYALTSSNVYLDVCLSTNLRINYYFMTLTDVLTDVRENVHIRSVLNSFA